MLIVSDMWIDNQPPGAEIEVSAELLKSLQTANPKSSFSVVGVDANSAKLNESVKKPNKD